MHFLEIISLENAKSYLSLDDTSRDEEVKRMIRSAIRFVEKRTNHILIEASKSYIVEDSYVRVYDYPFTYEDSDSIDETKKSTYSIFKISDSTTEELELSLGYDSLEDVPDDLIEGCYLMLKFYFYEQEGSGKIPKSVFETIDHHRRFII